MTTRCKVLRYGLIRAESRGLLCSLLVLLPLAFLPHSAAAQGPTCSGPVNVLTTAAGGVWDWNTNGWPDGIPATLTWLFEAWRVAAGPDGSLYITEYSAVRRIDPKGIIHLVAGNRDGVWGFSGDGGPAASAKMRDPGGVALGPDGSLYIADGGNHRVRRVGADGIITTVAGNGVAASSGDGGPATQASLAYPVAVAFGPDGSLYVDEMDGYRVRRVSPEGIITTVAGNGTQGYGGDGGPAAQAQLASTRDVVVTPDGRLLIADTYNNRIRQVTRDGIVTTIAGTGSPGFSGDGGPATAAQLNVPWGIDVGPHGSYYIMDASRVRRVGADGIITTVAGDGRGVCGNHDGTPALDASFGNPRDVAVAPDGSLYVADMDTPQRIRRVAPAPPAGLGVLPPPSITPQGGTYVTSAQVALSAAPGAEIRYTTNGCSPSANSSLYTGPIVLTRTTTISAKAFQPDWVPSLAATDTYTIKVATPTLTPPGRVYPSSQSVVLQSSTPNALISYSTDGQDPPSSPVVASGSAFVVDRSLTLKAKGWLNGLAASEIAVGDYVIAPLPALNLDGPPGDVSGMFTGWGWAYRCNGSIASYRLLVDGAETAGTPFTTGTQRPDVQAAFQSVCPSIPVGTGFTFELDSSTLTVGTHVLRVRITDDLGRVAESNPLTVNVKPFVALFLEGPAGDVSGVVTGWGLAFRCNGSIVSYQLLVDGVEATGTPFTAGFQRPDVQAGYQSVCPSVPLDTGFTFQLDSTKLTAGTHLLRVRVIDHLGMAAESNTLTVNASWFPVDLTGASGFPYFAWADGSIETVTGPCAVFCGSWAKIGSAWFNGVAVGSLSQSGREVSIGPVATSGLSVTRRVFVPPSGAFVRYLDVIQNPTAAPIAVPYLLEQYVHASSAGGWSVATTSDGDATFASGDHYAVLSPADPSYPETAVVVSGPGASRPYDGLEWTGDETGSWWYDNTWNLTVAPGQTVLLMQFLAQKPHGMTTDATGEAEALVNLQDPDALAGLTEDERAEILNFAVP